MNKKTIKGLKEIHEKYDAFFIDLWGVVHNGIKLYPEAIDVLENICRQKKRFILMSNAPRPLKDVQKFLLKMKMSERFIKNIFTSGEAAIRSLKQNLYGKNFYHLGPKRDSNLFEGFENNKKNIDKADFILCSGFLDGQEESLEYYKFFLKKYIRLKMVCTNPDLIVHRGKEKEYCAGTLANIFKELGGKVIYFGKPYPEIYNFCTKKNEKVLVIGDNIRTDIKGANNMNFDSLLITSGVHKDEFLDIKLENYEDVLKKYNVKTNYYQERLIW